MPDYSDLIAQVRPEQLDELILPFEQAISPDVTLANVRAMVGAPPPDRLLKNEEEDGQPETKNPPSESSR